jgi:general nucleoside transport system ATP-binding protein
MVVYRGADRHVTGAAPLVRPRPALAPALALHGITKRYGATLALEDAHCLVRPAAVHALLGENGAGKTTLMRVAFGLVAADAGTMTLDAVPMRFASARDAIAAGLGMVQQHFSLVPAMTVAENVALGGRGRFDARAAAAVVATVGKATGLTVDPTARIRDLPVAAQQRVEIIKALARNARVLILDEPTAVLAPDDARDLLQWLRGFADAGGSVVLITHKLADALALSDDITVLRRGRVVRSAPTGTWTHDSLVDAMVGAEVSSARAAATGGQVTRASSLGEGPNHTGTTATIPVLALQGVDVVDSTGVTRLRDATCAVHAGEIVGVAAVEGSGQHELLRLLAGRLVPSRGQVTRPDAVGFVPEDRHRDAVLLEASLTENVALRGAGAAQGLMPWGALRHRTAQLLAQYDVRAPGPLVEARTLSGGNQQKLVLARELDAMPAALVVENPTRGLDLVATAAVLDRLRAARDAGIAVVVHSSDVDEVLAVADRVLAVYDGRVTACAATRDAVGRAMLGGAAS